MSEQKQTTKPDVNRHLKPENGVVPQLAPTTELGLSSLSPGIGTTGILSTDQNFARSEANLISRKDIPVSQRQTYAANMAQRYGNQGMNHIMRLAKNNGASLPPESSPAPSEKTTESALPENLSAEAQDALITSGLDTNLNTEDVLPDSSEEGILQSASETAGFNPESTPQDLTANTDLPTMEETPDELSTPAGMADALAMMNTIEGNKEEDESIELSSEEDFIGGGDVLVADGVESPLAEPPSTEPDWEQVTSKQTEIMTEAGINEADSDGLADLREMTGAVAEETADIEIGESPVNLEAIESQGDLAKQSMSDSVTRLTSLDGLNIIPDPEAGLAEDSEMADSEFLQTRPLQRSPLNVPLQRRGENDLGGTPSLLPLSVPTLNINDAAIDQAAQQAIQTVGTLNIDPQLASLRNRVRGAKDQIIADRDAKFSQINDYRSTMGFAPLMDPFTVVLSIGNSPENMHGSELVTMQNQINTNYDREVERLNRLRVDAPNQTVEPIKAGMRKVDQLVSIYTAMVDAQALIPTESVIREINDEDNSRSGWQSFCDFFSKGHDFYDRKRDNAREAAQGVADAFRKSYIDSGNQTKKYILGGEVDEAVPTPENRPDKTVRQGLIELFQNEVDAQLQNLQEAKGKIEAEIVARHNALSSAADKLTREAYQHIYQIAEQGLQRLDQFEAQMESNLTQAQTVFSSQIQAAATQAKASLHQAQANAQDALADTIETLSASGEGADPDAQAGINEAAADIEEQLNGKVDEVASQLVGMGDELVISIKTLDLHDMISSETALFKQAMNDVMGQVNDQQTAIGEARDNLEEQTGNLTREFSFFGDTAEDSIKQLVAKTTQTVPEMIGNDLQASFEKAHKDLAPTVTEEAKKAADDTQTVWQRIGSTLWTIFVTVIIVAIITAVAIAITAATAGFGGILLAGLAGAAIGAVGGVIKTLGNNAILGRPLTEGMGREVCLGALTGLFAGLGTGALTAVFGTSSSSLTAGQLIAKESIDAAITTGAGVLIDIADQGLFQDAIDWDKVWQNALIGGAVNFMAKGVTKGKAALGRARNRPADAQSLSQNLRNQRYGKADVTPNTVTKINNVEADIPEIIDGNANIVKVGAQKSFDRQKFNELFLEKLKGGVNPIEGFTEKEDKLGKILANNAWVGQLLKTGVMKPVSKGKIPFTDVDDVIDEPEQPQIPLGGATMPLEDEAEEYQPNVHVLAVPWA